MAHHARYMQQLDDGRWVIKCRICPRHNRDKQIVESAAMCHRWWDSHVTTESHRFVLSAEGREWRSERRLFAAGMTLEEAIQYLTD